jgi:MFS family permease
MLQCSIWLPLMLLPLAFPDHAVALFIALVILYHAFSNLISPQWSSVMGDLVPQRKRGRYFGLRTRYATVTSFLTLLCAGSVLHWFDGRGSTGSGFLVIFTVAALARAASIYHLRQMHEPPRAVEPRTRTFDLQAWGRRLRNSTAVRFSLYFGLMQGAVAIASPFFTVYMLRDLRFSYIEFTTVTAASVLMHFLTLRTWGRISDAFGNRLILIVCGATITLFPLLWLVSTNFWFIIAVQVISGACWAGFTLAATNYLYDSVPAQKRSQYVAFHHVVAAVGVFCGAMLGGTLATALPNELHVGAYSFHWVSAMYGVFLLSSLARMAVAGWFLPRLKEVREVKRVTVHDFAWRMINQTPQLRRALLRRYRSWGRRVAAHGTIALRMLAFVAPVLYFWRKIKI